MIKPEDAIRTARSLIGTPYKTMDCIALIRAVIKRSPGGVADYRCKGTNWLWDSIKNSGRYQHLTERYEGLSGIPAGALAFKRYGLTGEDHVGIATDQGTIIHSSSTQGGRGVVETPLTAAEGWDCWGKHRYIETTPMGESKEEKSMYKAVVNTEKDPLRVREWPKTGTLIGHVPRGKVVEVIEDAGDGWPKIRYNELAGYVSGDYLLKAESTPGVGYEETEVETIGEVTIRTIIEDGSGRTFEPIGGFSVRTVLEVDGEAID